jgi:signal transduction histidine kinase
VITQYALLDSKKTYVRYISHELRTPMNTACLGLKYLIDSLDQEVDKDIHETLNDVNVACMTAVDILNDLLTFEKLESGILELHKTEESAISFIKECVNTFAVHALAKDISLTVSSQGDGVTTSRLYPRDMLKFDKFKMAQVIRNLISNALKFTPLGGTVTVKAGYRSRTEADSEDETRGASAKYSGSVKFRSSNRQRYGSTIRI